MFHVQIRLKANRHVVRNTTDTKIPAICIKGSPELLAVHNIQTPTITENINKQDLKIFKIMLPSLQYFISIRCKNTLF
ncbi:MAG: hypothetical protein A2328_07715 [Bdellovibrionales bacterium RIFOXYB2_FULL_36_6]|nr:MAG: hypothetical protein A2328_07715 [Bdellovibrionales bacterium RIFOXYB2_FULL_36_6]HBO99616.1 hypothetical protein [Candidatus Uhrbacteria bacterium]